MIESFRYMRGEKSKIFKRKSSEKVNYKTDKILYFKLKISFSFRNYSLYKRHNYNQTKD